MYHGMWFFPMTNGGFMGWIPRNTWWLNGDDHGDFLGKMRRFHGMDTTINENGDLMVIYPLVNIETTVEHDDLVRGFSHEKPDDFPKLRKRLPEGMGKNGTRFFLKMSLEVWILANVFEGFLKN